MIAATVIAMLLAMAVLRAWDTPWPPVEMFGEDGEGKGETDDCIPW